MFDTTDYDYSFRLDEPLEGDDYITFSVPSEANEWQA